MQTADWLQFASLMAVAAALLVSVLQNRETARQTKELTGQTDSIRKSLEQGAYQTANAAHDLHRVELFRDDPRLLQWYLGSRGYKAHSKRRNMRTLYIILKLEIHEGNYLNHKNGTLSDEMWEAWSEVLKADLQSQDFRLTWPNARRFYARTFAEFVDSIL